MPELELEEFKFPDEKKEEVLKVEMLWGVDSKFDARSTILYNSIQTTLLGTSPS